MSFILFILLLFIIIPVIGIKIFSLMYLLKEYTIFVVLFIVFICVIALFTNPTEDTFFHELEFKHGLQCNEMGICIAGQHVYTIEQSSSRNYGFFTTYHLKMTYDKGQYSREVNSLGAFYNIFTSVR